MHRVLIVDDEQMIHLSLRKIISSSEINFEVIGAAEDGLEALELVESTSPDVVITDIYMPEMDGLEFVEQARKTHPNLVFVILSGYNDFSFAQKAIRFGVTEFLLKPIEPPQLLETLQIIHEKLLSKSQLFNSHNQWLTTLNNLQKQLLEHIWALEEAQVIETIAAIHGHFENRPSQDVTLSQLTNNLLQWIEKELQKKGLYMPPYPNDWNPSQPNISTLESTRNVILEWLKFTRESRNLGSRLNMVKAIDYMKENYKKEDLSLKEAADFIGISTAYFSRSFKEEMHTSFIKYLIKLRMEEAKRLLEDSEVSTMEIAFDVGFSDYPHFSKTFKKFYGITPSECRKFSAKKDK